MAVHGDADALWVDYLTRAEFVVGGVPRAAGAPIRLAMTLPAPMRQAVGTVDALQRDGYVVVEAAQSSQLETVTTTLTPAVQGLWDMGADFNWGYARALFSLSALQTDVFSLMDVDRTAAWTRAFNALDQARESFEGAFYRECLDALEDILRGDESSPGYVLEWRVHFLVGVIRLGFVGGNHHLVDLAAAEHAFAHAARYGRREAPEVAVQSLCCAAWAASRQRGYQRATGYLDAASMLDDSLPEATFLRALLAIAAGRREDAFELLARTFAFDRGYTLRLAEAIGRTAAGPTFAAFLRDLGQQTWHRGIDPVAQCLDRLTFWRQHADDAPDDQELSRLDAYITEGETWPVYDVLQVLASREATADRLLGAADDKRIVATDVRPGPEIVREERHVSREPVREKVVVKPKSMFAKEQVEWRQSWRTVVHMRESRHQLTRRATTVYDGKGGILAEFDMMGLPRGTFDMGSPDTEAARADHERLHQVTLTRPFLIGVLPVTQGLWRVVMREHVSFFEGDDLPVEQVTWMDAVAFCNALSRLEGLDEAYLLDDHGAAWLGPDVVGYRLPTESEWEYAARAGTLSPWHTGDELDADHANYDRRRGAITVPAGLFPPNAWGLCDMHGNVWEWCGDAYGDYPTESATDPLPDGADEARVVRGGSWASDESSCRSASRANYSPWHRQNTVGFRLALTQAEAPASPRPAGAGE